MVPADTTPEAQAVQDRIHREMSDERRIEMTFGMIAVARSGIRDRLRRFYPDLDEGQLHRRMIAELYGIDVDR